MTLCDVEPSIFAGDHASSVHEVVEPELPKHRRRLRGAGFWFSRVPLFREGRDPLGPDPLVTSCTPPQGSIAKGPARTVYGRDISRFGRKMIKHLKWRRI